MDLGYCLPPALRIPFSKASSTEGNAPAERTELGCEKTNRIRSYPVIRRLADHCADLSGNSATPQGCEICRGAGEALRAPGSWVVACGPVTFSTAGASKLFLARGCSP